MKLTLNCIWPRLIVTAAIIVAAIGEVSAIDLTGQASVVDGDTLEAIAPASAFGASTRWKAGQHCR